MTTIPLWLWAESADYQSLQEFWFEQLKGCLPEHLDLKLCSELPRTTGDLVLIVGSNGLSLGETGKKAPKPIQVNFVSGKSAHRRQFGGGKGQMIAKAVGMKSGVKPSVVDVTAGLGGDAFVLAGLGCEMLLLERHPVVAALLQDGLDRAAEDSDAVEVTQHMRLEPGNSIENLAKVVEETGFNPQVVYVDPMFPAREKSAEIKKEMKLFHQLVGMDTDDDQLLAKALEIATHRVVVKRPRKAPIIAGPEPSYVLEGKSSRYDIYTKKRLGEG